jgi:hypothetical protein
MKIELKPIRITYAFLDRLGHDMLKIIRYEISRAGLGPVPKDFMDSWHYRVEQGAIHLWCDYAVPEPEPEVDEDGNPVEAEPVELSKFDSIFSLMADGTVKMRAVKPMKLPNGEWLFPANQEPIFMTRAMKRINDLVDDKISKLVEDSIHVG